MSNIPQWVQVLFILSTLFALVFLALNSMTGKR